MDEDHEESYDNNIADPETIPNVKEDDTGETVNANSKEECQNKTESNGFINKSFLEGENNEIPVIQVDDASQAMDDDVKIDINVKYNGEGVEMESPVKNKIGVENSLHSSFETNLGYMNGVGSVEDLDVPKYTPQFRSRKGTQMGSENLITNDDLLLAATLVQEAMEGQRVKLKTEPRFVRSYNYFKSTLFRGLLYLALVTNLCLVVFEDPEMPYLGLPYWVTMTIEGVCLSYFVFRLCHHAHWRLWSSTKKDIRNIFAAVLLVLTVVDMILYAIVTEVTTVHAVRWTRPTRPFLLMIFADGTHLRRAWSNIRRTLREIAHILIMFYFLIAVFSLVALKMFQHREDMTFADGSPYFKDYLESFWQLYVLVTTCNNPDVMLPAYDKNRWYCLFFTVYIILCLYLMLNILLAVTYNSYRENMKKQIKNSAKEKRKTLNEAFEVIKINVEGNEMVTYKTWSRLLRLAHPGKTKHQIDLLMMVLDTDCTGYISRQQFLSVADLLNVSVSEVSQRKTWMESHCTSVYMSRYSLLIKDGVGSIYFSLTFDGIVLANIILICLNIDTVDWLFYALFSIEIFLKWYTLGTKRYFNRFLNVTDVLITLLSLAILVLKALDFDKQGRINSEALSVFSVFRIFRIFRCLVHFERFRIIFDAVINVSVSIFTYCCILFIVFYFFAVLGMELFANRFAYLGYYNSNSSESTNYTDAAAYCNNTLLKDSVFATSQYCNNNFNDIINAFVVLSALLVAEGFVLVTNKAARLYFMCFHICITVVVMNIVTAFILDMFIYEYTFCKKGSIDTKVEATIKNLQIGIDDETGEEFQADENYNRREKSNTRSAFRRMTTRRKTNVSKPQLSRYDGIRFHIKKRGWTKTELLLQQLFELEEEDSDSESS